MHTIVGRLPEVVDFVATTRLMGQKGRRRMLRLPGGRLLLCIFFVPYTGAQPLLIEASERVLFSHLLSLVTGQKGVIYEGTEERKARADAGC